MSESLILTEIRGRVALITLNRPKALNALNNDLVNELFAALQRFDRDENIGAIVLTGNEKAFAAGADISAMQSWTYMDVYKQDYLGGNWDALRRMRKPIIAAVAGYALGGGCELAMLCDIIIAADNAKFGQPEIKLGVIPGFGGTQRLPRAVGKAKAMDLVLTARMMDAAEAERAGLVSRVVPADKLEALQAATVIASMSLPSVLMAKECVNAAYEGALNDTLLFERRNFHALFGTRDQKEGMQAFLEKRHEMTARQMHASDAALHQPQRASHPRKPKDQHQAHHHARNPANPSSGTHHAHCVLHLPHRFRALRACTRGAAFWRI